MDNIPGVAGVGSKTAVALLTHFPGGLDEIYNRLDEVREREPVHRALRAAMPPFSPKTYVTLTALTRPSRVRRLVESMQDTREVHGWWCWALNHRARRKMF